jgi:hypothetical protein
VPESLAAGQIEDDGPRGPEEEPTARLDEERARAWARLLRVIAGMRCKPRMLYRRCSAGHVPARRHDLRAAENSGRISTSLDRSDCRSVKLSCDPKTQPSETAVKSWEELRHEFEDSKETVMSLRLETEEEGKARAASGDQKSYSSRP